mmetsp:Transcript_137107/g.382362  ORF Transcript_137107/g.382362 Transcript_137107/m.382362 type:complete len:204 (-) Transcript_137107:182-793(-)
MLPRLPCLNSIARKGTWTPTLNLVQRPRTRKVNSCPLRCNSGSTSLSSPRRSSARNTNNHSLRSCRHPMLGNESSKNSTGRNFTAESPSSKRKYASEEDGCDCRFAMAASLRRLCAGLEPLARAWAVMRRMTARASWPISTTKSLCATKLSSGKEGNCWPPFPSPLGRRRGLPENTGGSGKPSPWAGARSVGSKLRWGRPGGG